MCLKRAGMMSQWLRPLAAVAEDLGSFPISYIAPQNYL